MGITDKVKKIMENVQPWQWVAGIIVVGVGLFSYIRNKGQTSQATTEEVPQATAGAVNPGVAPGDLQNVAEGLAGMISDIQTANDKALKDLKSADDAKYTEISGKLVATTDALNQSILNQNANVQKAIDSQSNSFQSAFNSVVNSLNSSVANTNNALQETTRSLTTQIQNVASQAPTAPAITGTTPTATQTVVNPLAEAQKKIGLLSAEYGNYFQAVAGGDPKKLTTEQHAYLNTLHTEANALRTANGLPTT